MPHMEPMLCAFPYACRVRLEDLLHNHESACKYNMKYTNILNIKKFKVIVSVTSMLSPMWGVWLFHTGRLHELNITF